MGLQVSRDTHDRQAAESKSVIKNSCFCLLCHFVKKEKKMTGHYKTRTALSMLFVIFAAFSYAVTGFASSELAPTGDGTPGNSVVSGFAIKNITYDLSTIDPSKIARVQMTVETEGGRQNAAHVTISADSGNTWVTCRNASGFLWTCDFPPTHELSVSQYSNLRVVAKN